MPDDCSGYGANAGLAPGREPIFAPGLRPSTPAGRLRKSLGIGLSMAWLLWPILDLATSDAPAWRMVVVYAGLVVWRAAQGLVHDPDLPPCFSSTRMPSITMPRSIALTMS